MSSRRWWIAAVSIPLVGLVLLIARAELRLATGQVFRVEIAGFDPRDLLHGHYLQYQYVFDWRGEPTCGTTTREEPLARPDPSCCICLTSGPTREDPPSARQVSCEEASSCDAHLRPDVIAPPRRYFIPEQSASALEHAFTQHRAAVDLSVSPNGDAAVRELYLDGLPWRAVVEP